MQELGAIDSPDGEPWLVCMPERIGNDGEAYASTCESEDVTEQAADFMRNSVVRGYFPIGGVIILGVAEGDLKHVDKLLKVSVLMNGSTTFIKVPVIAVSETDGWSEFSRVNNTTPSGVKRTIELIRGDEVKIGRGEWLGPEFIPAYQPTVFTGEMDTRKSTLALQIAAAGSAWLPWFMHKDVEKEEVELTNGKTMMVNACRPPLITLIAAAEDTYSTTVVPRFKAAGGDLSNIYCCPLSVRYEKQDPDGLQVWETP